MTDFMIVVDIFYSPLAESNYFAFLGLSSLTLASLRSNFAFIACVSYFGSFFVLQLLCWLLDSKVIKGK